MLKVKTNFAGASTRDCNKPSKPLMQAISYSLTGEENGLQLRSPMPLRV